MPPRRARRHLASATAATVLISTVVWAAPATAAPPAPTASPKATAKAPAKPVEVAATDSATLTANPDGTYTLLSSSSPQRVRQGGKWVPIDTSLVRNADGTYSPRAAETAMSIGGGGSRLIQLRDGANTMTFTWPTALPTPTVSGSTATYANVLPDVDLQVTADPTGYSSILVVKTAAAAANPALQQLDLGMATKHLKITETSNGGAEAADVATGRTVFHADTSLMWDSSPARADLSATPAPTNLGGHVSKINVRFGGGRQHLTLDHAMLTAKTTKFPVYVDPVWSGNPSQKGWARISSNGWNVYNSTSTTGSNSPRIGLDDWPADGGAGEQARTYYSMNTSGLHGAIVSSARMYVVERWASSCYNTSATIYGAGPIDGWSTSGLNWGHQPSLSAALASASGGRIDCGKSTERTSPSSLSFDVTDWLKKAAAGNWNIANFMLQATNMSDKYAWKQLKYGGGATLSVTYSFRPKLMNGTGTPKITPSVIDQGRTLTTTHTPTLSARATDNGADGKPLENVRILYDVYNSAGTLVGQGFTGYSQNGGDWTTPSLADGNYTWKATAENASTYWVGPGAGVWTATQSFTVDTTAPPAPYISSTQFPSGQIGAAFGTKGTFALSTDRVATNNVVGYLFALDGDLASTVYAPNKFPAWTTSTTITPGTVYFAKADNATGTGTAVTNGSAALGFAPGTAGPHTLFAKAVDGAGSTSPQKPYLFNAGTKDPTYAYGDKLISGWTATNDDGTTTVVPPATTTSAGGQLIIQPSQPGYFFADGNQAMLSNKASTYVANGDTATFSFDIPHSGFWEIGANLTTGVNYGTYSLTLDAGTANATVLIPGFDAYSNPTNTTYRSFGLVQDANSTPRNLAKGLHTITLTVLGANAKSTGYQAGIDVLRLSSTLGCAINDTAGCLNNTAISTLTPGSPATITKADADGGGTSIDATMLRNAGWTPGRTVTVDGAAIKLPDTFGDGNADNMIASGQMITVPSTTVNKGNAIVFVGFGTVGTFRGATGTVKYAPNTCKLGASQAYTIDSVTDWAFGTAGNTILTMPGRDNSNATQSPITASLFALSVPLACPGATITSLTLPLVSNGVAGQTAVHVLGLGIRPVSATGSGTTTVRWAGSWAAAQDTAAITGTTLTNQTIRIPAHLSLGADTHNKIRVRLSNALGTTPVTFDAASVALDDGTGGGTPAATPIRLTFGGSNSATLPAGTDLISDPITLTAPQQATVLVSLEVHGNVTAVAGHRDARNPVYISAADGADHTTDVSGFTASAMTGIPYVSAVDVSTSTTAPAGSLVVYGDQTINSDTATADGLNHLSDQLATAFTGEYDGTVPLGVLNEGSSSGNNQALLPALGNAREALNATAPIDRAILTQSDVRVALVSSGTSDLLTCTSTTAATCAGAVEDKLVALATQLHQYSPDDATTDAIDLPDPSRHIKVYVATLPPFTGTHTATQESARELVNAYILGDVGAYLQGYADGVIDFAAAVSTGGDDVSDTVKDADLTAALPNDAYYFDLAQQYLTQVDLSDGDPGGIDGSADPGADPIAYWDFNAMDGDTVPDHGNGTGVSRTTHDGSLHDVTAGAGRLLGATAGTFNGTTSYVDSGLAVNTARSFTVSAWVRLTDTTANRTIYARDATGFASLYLQYRASDGNWIAQMPSSTSGTPTWKIAISAQPAQAGIWTHLAVVYDATAQSLTIYANGTGTGAPGTVASFNDPAHGSLIGHADSTWFAGDIAEVKVWGRALSEPEVDTEAAPVQVVGWQLNESAGTTAGDTSSYGHDGTLQPGAGWTAGHTADPRDYAVHLNGASGTIDAAAPVLRTDQSFTVAAWARISATTGNRTVITQESTHGASFMLQYNGSCVCWAFITEDSDIVNPTTRLALSARNSVVYDRWTHIAGVYDATAKTLSLYVDGVLAGTPTAVPTTYQASGSFIAGRTRWSDVVTDWFPGDIDSVQAYQGALSPTAIQTLATS